MKDINKNNYNNSKKTEINNSPISEFNTCITDPNLKVFTFSIIQGLVFYQTGTNFK